MLLSALLGFLVGIDSRTHTELAPYFNIENPQTSPSVPMKWPTKNLMDAYQ